ncbi:interferon-induced very large GTPase 1-like, partial [Silurus asotus]
EEDKKHKTEQLFKRLNLEKKQKQKMNTSEVLQITPSLDWRESCTEKDLVETFIQRLLMMNYRARHITTKKVSSSSEHSSSNTRANNDKNDDDDVDDEDEDEDGFAKFLSMKTKSLESEIDKSPVHPMDVQMAALHCSDLFLKQLIVTKLTQCQYALPLLVPNPFTKEIQFPLWTFR